MRALFAPLLLLSVAATPPPVDDVAIRASEAVWHGSPTVEDLHILLADDFTRPAPNGQIWGKAEQIAWIRERPAPPGFTGKTERLDIRFFGDAAVATGVAVIHGPAGNEVDRTIFTDVYVKRSGKWLMVSAQRGPVTKASAK